MTMAPIAFLNSHKQNDHKMTISFGDFDIYFQSFQSLMNA